MSKTVDLFFLSQTEGARLYVDAFCLLETKEVLRYVRTVTEIEEYLISEKESLIKELETFLKEKRKYLFKETGEKVIICQDVLEYDFNFKGNLGQFKRYLKKATIKELEHYLYTIKELIIEKD